MERKTKSRDLDWQRALEWAHAHHSLYTMGPLPPQVDPPERPTYREALALIYGNITAAKKTLDVATDRSRRRNEIAAKAVLRVPAHIDQDLAMGAVVAQVSADFQRAAADVAHWREMAAHYSALLERAPGLATERVGMLRMGLRERSGGPKPIAQLVQAAIQDKGG